MLSEVRLRAAAGVAKALNYMHQGGAAQRCFHRDVKSGNICLTGALRAKLIDCGLAKYAPEEVDAHSSSLGRFGTAAYMCPRYAIQGGYNVKSETYSFGIVLLELLTGKLQLAPTHLVETFIEDAEDGDLRAAMDPHAGWPAPVFDEVAAVAADALQSSLKKRCTLQPVLQVLARLEREHAGIVFEEEQLERFRQQREEHQREQDVREAQQREQRRQCQVCFEDFDTAEGICCPADHFLCADCLAGHTQAEVHDENLERFRRRHGVQCPALNCGHIYANGPLARHVPEATFALYLQARERLVEAAATEAAERDMARRLAAERAEGRLGQARRYVQEEILTLRCPRCQQAFVDFDGCCALTCSRAGCGCGFCGFCLQDCGRNAHAHVRRCGLNPRQDYFVSEEQFREIQKCRRTRLVQAYLAELEPETRERLLRDLARDFADLNIHL
ncbi:PIX13 [Symbiodinium natans]|uniref:PIX13 protein n=1 Tax=Symbiodinium natans TaxID=878477 RepID=A0A812U8Z0_9DINO|nr:PIX13 [Symbiodinium natans]